MWEHPSITNMCWIKNCFSTFPCNLFSWCNQIREVCAQWFVDGWLIEGSNRTAVPHCGASTARVWVRLMSSTCATTIILPWRWDMRQTSLTRRIQPKPPSHPSVWTRREHCHHTLPLTMYADETISVEVVTGQWCSQVHCSDLTTRDCSWPTCSTHHAYWIS